MVFIFIRGENYNNFYFIFERTENDVEYNMSPCISNCKGEHTRMWANAQRDGRPARYRWRPLFNAAKFG